MTESAAGPAAPEPRSSALDADGYVVVPTGLPPSILEAVVDDIWRHAGATARDPATWYQPAIIRPRPGMVEMYHYQSMWDVRQHPAVYGIFRDLHRTDELWVSIDRVAFKPPVRPDQPGYDQGAVQGYGTGEFPAEAPYGQDGYGQQAGYGAPAGYGHPGGHQQGPGPEYPADETSYFDTGLIDVRQFQQQQQYR